MENEGRETGMGGKPGMEPVFLAGSREWAAETQPLWNGGATANLDGKSAARLVQLN